MIRLKEIMTKLTELHHQPMDEHNILVEATLYRFKATFLALCKTLEFLFRESGTLLIVNSYKDLFKEAYQWHLINDEELLLSMIDDYNQFSEASDKKIAILMFTRIQKYVPLLQNAVENISKEIERLS